MENRVWEVRQRANLRKIIMYIMFTNIKQHRVSRHIVWCWPHLNCKLQYSISYALRRILFIHFSRFSKGKIFLKLLVICFHCCKCELHRTAFCFFPVLSSFFFLSYDHSLVILVRVRTHFLPSLQHLSKSSFSLWFSNCGYILGGFNLPPSAIMIGNLAIRLKATKILSHRLRTFKP